MGLEILIMMLRAGAKFQTGEATKTLKQISGRSLRANSNNNRANYPRSSLENNLIPVTISLLDIFLLLLP